MQFGNWKVSQDGITWSGKGNDAFVIPIDLLNAKKTKNNEGDYLYDWILEVTEKDWLSDDDLYDFNYAFVYAIARSGLDFNYKTFDATLEEQYNLCGYDEDEDDEDE